MEHLHGRLAQLRDDVAQVSLQRDQAQMQVKLLQAELDTWQILTKLAVSPEDGSWSCSQERWVPYTGIWCIYDAL